MNAAKLDPWSRGRQTAGEAYLSNSKTADQKNSLPELHEAVTTAADQNAVIFIDGTERMDMPGMIPNVSNIPVSADFWTIAAGAAITYPGSSNSGPRAAFSHQTVKRYAVSSSKPLLPITTVESRPIPGRRPGEPAKEMEVIYEHLHAADETEQAAKDAISSARSNLEIQVLRKVREDRAKDDSNDNSGDIYVIDGPVPDQLTDIDRLIGWIKSTQKFPVPLPWLTKLATLKRGQYSEAFFRHSNGVIRSEWFTAARNPNAWEHPTAHLVRLQTSNTEPERIKELQQWSSLHVPQYATKSHQSQRSPQQPAPIEALERELRNHMSNPKLRAQGLRSYYNLLTQEQTEKER